MGKSNKGAVIVQIIQFYDCPYCDYSVKKHGTGGTGWCEMIERLHKKRCKCVGRTEQATSTTEKRDENLKREGLVTTSKKRIRIDETLAKGPSLSQVEEELGRGQNGRKVSNGKVRSTYSRNM